MADKRVTVRKSNGSSKTFKVLDRSGTFYVNQVSFGMFSNDYREVGRARSFADALEIARVIGGGSNITIADW
jgi:hypothetical protein